MKRRERMEGRFLFILRRMKDKRGKVTSREKDDALLSLSLSLSLTPSSTSNQAGAFSGREQQAIAGDDDGVMRMEEGAPASE